MSSFPRGGVLGRRRCCELNGLGMGARRPRRGDSLGHVSSLHLHEPETTAENDDGLFLRIHGDHSDDCAFTFHQRYNGRNV